MKKKKIRPPVKTHGGKHYMADFIIGLFPEDYREMTYCEPMCAGASVFLNKDRSSEEVINDIDAGIVALYKAIRDEPEELVGRIKKIKYTEKNFKAAQERVTRPFDDYIEHAVNEYVVRRMSRGGLRKTFGWSDRQRGGQPGDLNAWSTMLEEIPRIAERVKGVTILNVTVFEVLKAWDETTTLFYLDPPYLPETRSVGSRNAYEHEMTTEDHVKLLDCALNARGKVVISGYQSPLYTKKLSEWNCKTKSLANNSGQGERKERRVEHVWMNY